MSSIHQFYMKADFEVEYPIVMGSLIEEHQLQFLLPQNQINSNPLFRQVTPRSTKVLVKTCACVQLKKKCKSILVTYTLLTPPVNQSLNLFDYSYVSLGCCRRILENNI